MRSRAAAAVAVIAAVSALFACSDSRGTEIKAGPMTYADSADQVFFDVQAPFEADGVKRGTLYADTMYVLNESSRFDFTVGHVDFNTETGTPNGSMKADRGRYDQRSQILEGWGHVVLKTVDGRTLKSPHVIYNQLRDEIWSDTTFEVVEGGRVSTGVGFHTDHTLAKRKCDRQCNVKGSVTIK